MPAAASAAINTAPPSGALIKIIRDRVESKRSSGVVVGVVDRAGARTEAYGDPGPRQPALGQLTVFELGSLTKVFTATLLSKMALRGEVALTDPVSALLPPTSSVPTRGGRQIRLIDLATHTSGLPRLPTNLRSKDPVNRLAGYTADDLNHYLRDLRLTREIGSEYEYSDTGYGLLGYALGLKAGLGYGELLRAHILEPLGLAMTGTELTPALRRRLALPHDERGQLVGCVELGVLEGSGAVLSSVTDMLTFARANIVSTGDLLHRAMLQAHEPRHRAAGDQQVALGWHLRRLLDREFVWHSGETAGSRSFIGLDKQACRAVVVLSNSSSPVEDLGFHLLDDRNPAR